MEPEGSLQCSKEPTAGSHLSQKNPVHTTPSYFLKYILVLSSHLCLGLPSGVFPSRLSTKTHQKTRWYILWYNPSFCLEVLRKTIDKINSSGYHIHLGVFCCSPKTFWLNRKERSRNSCSVSGARVETRLHHTNRSAGKRNIITNRYRGIRASTPQLPETNSRAVRMYCKSN